MNNNNLEQTPQHNLYEEKTQVYSNLSDKSSNLITNFSTAIKNFPETPKDHSSVNIPAFNSNILSKNLDFNINTEIANDINKKRFWTNDEDDLLKKLVEKHGARNWRKISSFFINRTDVQCLHRWQKVQNPNQVKGMWTTQEDDILFN